MNLNLFVKIIPNKKIFIIPITFLSVLLLFGALAPEVFATTSGPLSPGTMATDSGSGGIKNWTTPDNAKVEDGTTTTAAVGDNASPPCLAPDSLIFTKNGNKAIKDLKDGDLVYSYNFASKKIELKEASNIIKVPISQAGNRYYHIYFGGGDIRATYDHLFYVDDKFVMAKDLKIGDELFDINARKQSITEVVIKENYDDYVWDFSVSGNQNFFANGVLVHNVGTYDKYVRIVKGGTIGSADRASGTAWSTSLAYTTYGSSSDLWGETGWTAEIINASNFGVAVSAYGSGYVTSNWTTYYLVATNFGFNIPAGAVINGITVEIKKKTNSSTGPVSAYIDYIRITVDYTTGDTTPPTVSTLSPADNAPAVAVDSNLVITFSEAVDTETGANNDIVIKKTSDNSTIETIDAQDAKVTGSGTATITINPTATLSGGTGYYIQIGADAFDDAAGNSYAGIADATTWNFTSAGMGMSSTNYNIKIDSLNSAGGDSQVSSSGFKMKDTVGEVGTGESASTNYKIRAGYRQMDDNFYISINVANDVNLGTLSGFTGGIATGDTTWTVVTDNPAGYSLSVKAGASPALSTGTYNIADYTPAGGVASPDFNWSIGSIVSEFGFSPYNSASQVSKFKNDGAACNSGSTITAWKCWFGFLTGDTQVANRTSSTTGENTNINFQAEINTATGYQEDGTYTASITATAVAN